MRGTFLRIGTIVTILATVGSFLLSLREAVLSSGQGPPSGEVIHSLPRCNWHPYEARLRHLRSMPRVLRPSGQEKLGEDSHFSYSYDHETGTGICEWLENPPAVRVDASRGTPRDERRQTVILVCIIIVVVSATLMKLIRLIRWSREQSKLSRRASP